MATDDEALRIEALTTAARIAMSTNLGPDAVLEKAREYYAFLSGTEQVDPTKEMYRLVLATEAEMAADPSPVTVKFTTTDGPELNATDLASALSRVVSDAF